MRRLALVLPFLLLAPAGQGGALPGGVQVVDVSTESAFPDAAAPGAISRVCAATESELRASFAERAAPYDPTLVHERRGLRCHVDYVPTAPGFRADSEDRPVRELFMNVDGLGLLARRSGLFGDSLDISKALVAGLPRPLPITLGTRLDVADRWFEQALAFHYGERAGSIGWRRSVVSSLSHPWAQDFLKSGRVGGEPRILVTRRLFEGRRQDGEPFRPLLDSLHEERFVRSRLSWEGGDLQFIRHPRHPEQLVLVHGDSARAYWGEALAPQEYDYVLRREFGADVSVDLSDLAPHVDYAVAFLPADRIALVSEPMSGNRALAVAAATALEERFQGAPPPTLVELREALAREDALSSGRRPVEKLLDRAKREAREGWPGIEDRRLQARMERHVAARCPGSPADCFADGAVEGFLESDPELIRDWAAAALSERTDSVMDLRLLSVVESQLTRKPPANRKRLDAAVGVLEELGFRVIRVPRFGGDRSLRVPWSGISYANSLLVDRTLFVPRFGLGEFETRMFDELDAALPPEYEVVPVYARHMMLYNGGVHCSVAIVRE